MDWLHEYVDSHLDAQTLAQRLALTGTEVERVEHHGISESENFVVGHVLERRKHPDADRLGVCMVDVGGSTPVQIVCGAPNVAAGQTVGVVRPGGVMPDGTKIKRSKLRGETSDGMILSERELLISTEHDGIMVLGEDLKPGTALTGVLPVSTEVLVLEITPNRPDCLGIYGIAREVAASTGAQLKPPPWMLDLGSEGTLAGLEVVNEAGDELCPRFTARVFDDVKPGPSPLWMKARLMAAGQRPISNIVDITNYVMLLTGQPMHAFDYDKVAGRRLTVRPARAGEQVETLDEQTRTLDPDVVVIDDADGPTSIAGVMGGARSEVSSNTVRVISEAATWNGPNIHRTSLKLGLRSEASSRYEKQLQPEQTLWAQALATKLMIEVCGAKVRAGTIDVGGAGPEPLKLPLRDARVQRLLGVPVTRERAAQVLGTLGFVSEPVEDGLSVTVPDFRRGDITREIDLIEEVARIEVLQDLPATLPSRRQAFGRLTPRQQLDRTAADALTAQGLHEVVGWSFTGPDVAQRLLLDEAPAVKLENPMSSEQSQLRTTLLGSLLEVAAHNRALGQTRIGIFEAGRVYLPTPPDGGGDGAAARSLPAEPQHVAALLLGPVRAPTWRESAPRAADFFAAKGVLGGLLDALGADWTVEADPTAAYLHPGRAARVLIDGEPVGWLGELHPAVASGWEIEQSVAGFEIDLDAVPPAPVALYRDLISFPAVREDIAVVVAETVSAARLTEVVRTAGAKLLEDVDVFDVYRDAERLGEGNVSLALRLSFRAHDRTLTDAEVARQRQLIMKAVEQHVGGKIRGG
jgi:phenylalanyl-tRNA synthetase beta chain